MSSQTYKIGVIGAGTWGMALSRMLSNTGHEVTVWSALPAEIENRTTTTLSFMLNIPAVFSFFLTKLLKNIKFEIEAKEYENW